MPLVTPLKKVPLEGHFGAPLKYSRSGAYAGLASNSLMLHNRRDGLA